MFVWFTIVASAFAAVFASRYADRADDKYPAWRHWDSMVQSNYAHAVWAEANGDKELEKAYRDLVDQCARLRELVRMA